MSTKMLCSACDWEQMKSKLTTTSYTECKFLALQYSGRLVVGLVRYITCQRRWLTCPGLCTGCRRHQRRSAGGVHKRSQRGPHSGGVRRQRHRQILLWSAAGELAPHRHTARGLARRRLRPTRVHHTRQVDCAQYLPHRPLCQLPNMVQDMHSTPCDNKDARRGVPKLKCMRWLRYRFAVLSLPPCKAYPLWPRYPTSKIGKSADVLSAGIKVCEWHCRDECGLCNGSRVSCVFVLCAECRASISDLPRSARVWPAAHAPAGTGAGALLGAPVSGEGPSCL